MPRYATPASALVELRLVRDVLADHTCSHDSLACSLGLCTATVGHWLSGERRAGAGLIVGLIDHDRDAALSLLVRLAERAGIDVGEVLREQARREVCRDALLDAAAQLVDVAEQLPVALKRAA